MVGVYLVNVLDVARSLGIDPTRVTPESVAQWLVAEYMKKRRGRFNYNPAINKTFELFRGRCPHQTSPLSIVRTTAEPRYQTANQGRSIPDGP